MTSTRKISLTAGVFYLLTFVSIPILYLYGPGREAGYILGPGPDTRVFVGAVLEIIVALAGIGTAVALYPVVKRQNEGVALGFVAVRTLEVADESHRSATPARTTTPLSSRTHGAL